VLAPGTLVRAGLRAWIIDRYFFVDALKPAIRAAAGEAGHDDLPQGVEVHE
jgi:hypothetical protein